MTITAEQREQRQHSIGSSDAAAATGLSPYATPLDLYLEKVGEREPFEGNVATTWGERLEAVIGDAYAEETGETVILAPPTLTHPERPWMTATLDRLVEGKPRILEIKNTGQYMADEWGPSGTTIRDAAEVGVIPVQHLAQTHHQMVVANLPEADVVVLIGGRDLRIYHVELDERFAEVLVREEERFWKEHVLPRIPPPPITVDDLETLFALDDGTAEVATLEQIQAVADLKDVKASIKDLETRRGEIEIIVKGACGAASVLTDPEGTPLATWKAQTRATFDAKRLLADHPDIHAEYAGRSDPFRVLRLATK